MDLRYLLDDPRSSFSLISSLKKRSFVYNFFDISAPAMVSLGYMGMVFRRYWMPGWRSQKSGELEYGPGVWITDGHFTVYPSAGRRVILAREVFTASQF